MARKAISNKLRFEVFKRDKFTCQYCGSRAPDVILNIDHIEPVAKGGKTTLLNLVTSCFTCNSGKSDKQLADGTMLSAQLDQLALIQERRNQLTLIKKWLSETDKLQDQYVDAVEARIQSVFGHSLTEHGRKKISSHIRTFGFMEVIDCVDIAAERYSDVDTAFSKLSGILHNRKNERECPGYGKLSMAFAILKRRFGDQSKPKFWSLANKATDKGIEPEWILRLSQTSQYASNFFTDLEEEIYKDESDEDA